MLIIKHTKSEYLFLQDIAKLKELADRQKGKQTDGNPTIIEFELNKIHLKPLIRQSKSANQELIDIDYLSF